MGAGENARALAARNDRSLRPRVGRVVAYFAVTLGLFLLPWVVAGLDLALAPPAYILHPEALPPGGTRVQRFDDGSIATVRVLATDDLAKSALAGLVRSTPTRSFSQTNGTVTLIRYVNAVTGRSFAHVRIGRVVVGVEAADRAGVDRRLADLDVVSKNPHGDPMLMLFDEHLRGVLAGLGIYVLGLALFMLRGASWAARVDPRPGAPAVTAEELRARLLQVNELALPWRLEERRPGLFRAEWVYVDARWLAAQGAGQIRATQRLTLRLDERRRRVSVIQSTRSRSASAGVQGLSASFSFSRGITFFAYETGVGAGLIFRDGRWQLAEAYRYRFSLAEMQNPLVEATVDSGWTYAPSMTLIRWLGG